ncbi:hypothetical protein [Actinoplanes sp. NPDC023714]|uniref:hypothetical protein n=1 Tax=Actinoplanes sp. NPDC023714 TaxID=3154322 RepID=UPI0033C95363
MSRRAQIEGAVDALYDAFAGYPLRDWTDPCPHCHTADDERVLRRAPLRELTADDLPRYTMDAMTVWGDVGDFKHFLPRIMEIAVGEGFGWPDVEIVYGRIAYGFWTSWPAAEQTAIRRLVMAHWHAVLAADVDLFECDTVLTCIMLIEDDLTPYLRYWEQSDDPVPLLNLAEYAAQVGRIRAGERQWNAYLDGSKGPAQVLAWLGSDDLTERLTARRGTPPVRSALEQVLRAIHSADRRR